MDTIEPQTTRAARVGGFLGTLAALGFATAVNVVGWVLLLQGFRLGLWVLLFAGGLAAFLLWA